MSLRSLFAASRPHVAVGIAPDRVSAIAVAGRPGAPTVTAHASEPLPSGAVAPHLTGANIADRNAVAGALRRVFDRLGQKPRRVVLAVPDTVAKVSLLRFEKVPARADDLDQMIRWQLRKAAPFKIEEGQVTSSRGVAIEGGGREYVVVLARRDVVREYEAVCEQAGAHAGLVDLATLGVISVGLDGHGAARPHAEGARDGGSTQPGDWLLVHVTSQYATMAILRGGHLIFFRNRGDEAEGNLTGLVHQTAMYYEDRLGGQRFAKVVLVGGGATYGGMESGEWLRRNLEQRLSAPVEVIPADTVRFADRIAADPALVDMYLPLVGLLRR